MLSLRGHRARFGGKIVIPRPILLVFPRPQGTWKLRWESCLLPLQALGALEQAAWVKDSERALPASASAGSLLVGDRVGVRAKERALQVSLGAQASFVTWTRPVRSQELHW